MARKAGKYICNRCGRKIDTANDLDCVEAKTFQTRFQLTHPTRGATITLRVASTS